MKSTKVAQNFKSAFEAHFQQMGKSGPDKAEVANRVRDRFREYEDSLNRHDPIALAVGGQATAANRVAVSLSRHLGEPVDPTKYFDRLASIGKFYLFMSNATAHTMTEIQKTYDFVV